MIFKLLLSSGLSVIGPNDQHSPTTLVVTDEDRNYNEFNGFLNFIYNDILML